MIPDFPAKQIASDLIEAKGTKPTPEQVYQAVYDWEYDNCVFLTESEQDDFYKQVRGFIDRAVVSITFPIN